MTSVDPPAETTAPALRLWGVPELRLADTAVRFTTERRFQLLLVLALADGHWIERDRIAALLWPNHGMPDARRNLRKVVFDAHALVGPFLLESHGQALRWPVHTDLAVCQAHHPGQAAIALGCRRGPPLQGLDDARNGTWCEWLAAERARLDRCWLSAAQAHLLALENGSASAEVRAAVAQGLLAVDALDETAIAVLLRAQLAQGQLAQAQTAYRRYATALAQELGVEPSHRLRDLMATAANPSAAKTAAQAPAVHVTPRPSGDGFIGRRHELGELQALLERPECRLLTLLGPGGVGKSSLARQAITRCTPLFPGGVLWLELQDLSDAEELLPRWAQQLGLNLPAGGDKLAALLDQWSPARSLLVLDNAEHLPTLAPLLQRVVEAAPSLVLLVTSRVRLHLADEWLLPLPGLAVPDEDSHDLQAASSFDAVRLFERRAQTARRNFVLAEHLDAVIRITEAVAGLPLAIELAAGWVRLMPPAEIVRELQGSLDLLQHHPADRQTAARPEHGNLRHVLDRSVALLSVAERQALAALSVFQGGFLPDAARALGLPATLPLLSALVDKSLLALDTQAGSEGGPGRFRLHPLVQSYAAELLATDPVAGTRVRHAHARHFASFMNQLAPLTRTDAQRLVTAVEGEYGNVLAAWREAVALQDATLLGQLVRALWVCFELTGRLREGADILRPALDLLATQAQPVPQAHPAATWALARLRHGLSMLLHRGGHQEDGLAVAQAGIGAGLAGAELEAHLGCVLNSGSCLLALARTGEAHVHFGQALELARAHGDRHCTAWALGNLAVSHLELGQPPEALACGEQALAIDRELGNQYQVAVHLINLGSTLVDLKQLDRAVAMLRAGVAHCKAFKLRIFAIGAGANLSAALLRMGRLEEARAQAQDVLAQARACGHRSVQVGMLGILCRVDLAAGREAAALVSLREAVQLSRAHALHADLQHMLRNFARVLHARSDRVGAARVLDMLLAHSASTPADAAAFAVARRELALDAEETQAALARPLTREQALAWLEGGAETA